MRLRSDILTKKIRTNPNGNLTIKELVIMIHNGSIDNYMRKHSLVKDGDKCPPYKLIASDQQCYYCVSCFRHCISQIKEYKNHYQVGKEKFIKEDLDKEEML